MTTRPAASTSPRPSPTDTTPRTTTAGPPRACAALFAGCSTARATAWGAVTARAAAWPRSRLRSRRRRVRRRRKRLRLLRRPRALTATAVAVSAAAGSPASAATVPRWRSAGTAAASGHKKNFAPCHASTVMATAQVQPAAQAFLASAQVICGDPGCGMKGRHSHFGNLANKIRCRLCGGGGCGGCGGTGWAIPAPVAAAGGAAAAEVAACSSMGTAERAAGFAAARAVRTASRASGLQGHGLLGGLGCSTTRSSTTSSAPAGQCR